MGTETPREVLLFTLEAQRYALPTSDVRELLRAVRLTPLPRAPAVIEGLLNLRGELLPVLDMRRRFRLPALARRAARLTLRKPAGLAVLAEEDAAHLPGLLYHRLVLYQNRAIAAALGLINVSARPRLVT